jgi:hypothetical protein
LIFSSGFDPEFEPVHRPLQTRRAGFAGIDTAREIFLLGSKSPRLTGHCALVRWLVTGRWEDHASGTGRLGVIANIQALWAYPDTYIVDLTQPKIGPKRSDWLYPFGALQKAGAVLAGSSDGSVSSMNPLEAIQTGVTRQDIADPNGVVTPPPHTLDVMDMLRAHTVNGAYAAFDEEESGTLTTGKRAECSIRTPPRSL